MEKSPEAFRTIREVAEAMDLPQHVLRFWETRFPEIRPLKRAGGRRYYRPDDVERLRLIRRLLYDEGYTIKGVQKLFKEQGVQKRATGALDAPPLKPVEGSAAQDSREEASGLGDADIGFESPPPTAAWEEAPAPIKPRLSPDELAALHSVLADIREAERILSQTRPQQA
jgi:DNA-binding transcriptional MerR regulator